VARPNVRNRGRRIYAGAARPNVRNRGRRIYAGAATPNVRNWGRRRIRESGETEREKSGKSVRIIQEDRVYHEVRSR